MTFDLRRSRPQTVNAIHGLELLKANKANRWKVLLSNGFCTAQAEQTRDDEAKVQTVAIAK